MLSYTKVESPEQIHMILSEKFSPQTETWIVSDLKSKNEIQAAALAKFGFYTDDAILRASDFWRLWLRRLSPEMNLVSRDFIRALVFVFVDLYKDELEIAESEISTLYKAVEEFAPIILHPASSENLREWMAVQAQPKKWFRWYLLAKACLGFIVKERRALDPKWAAAWIQSLDLSQFNWPRKIYVDLGSEMTSIEMGLFQSLAQKQNIEIIVPADRWKKKFPNLLSSYLDGFSSAQDEESKIELEVQTDARFVRLSTQLAEVKYVVSEVRGLLERGNSFQQIAIISPDIETYWPVLAYYLKTEGIPCKKEILVNLNGINSVQRLLAQLKSLSNEVDWHSLETSFYSNHANHEMIFEKFKSLFVMIFDEDDLRRNNNVANLFYRKENLKGEVGREEFMAFIVKCWLKLDDSGSSDEIFEIIARDILVQSQNVRMPLNRWIQFLKLRLSRKEIVASYPFNSDGIYILPLMAAHLVRAQNKFYLGMTDESFQKKRFNLIHPDDARILKNQFDLAISTQEESYLDFNLRWQSHSRGTKSVYCMSYLSFAGEPLNPCLYFLENASHSELSIPGITRADELQSYFASFSEIEGDPKPALDFSNLRIAPERLRQDLTGAKIQISGTNFFKSLGTSDIEDFAKCSFKLLAKKGFILRDYPALGLDLDPRQKGSLVHFAFQKTLELMQENTFSIQKMQSLLDEKRSEMQLYPLQEAFWTIQRTKISQLILKFYEIEKERNKLFEFNVEKEIVVYFDFECRKFVKEPTASCYKLNFRIDRYDRHREKNYVLIYDYKSSPSQIGSFGKWLSELQFQMLLYIVALEATLGDAFKIEGALYYLYKTFEINKGMVSEEIGISELGLKKINKALISNEARAELLTNFQSALENLFLEIQKFEFVAKPADIEFCNDCDWIKICRAPHLI